MDRISLDGSFETGFNKQDGDDSVAERRSFVPLPATLLQGMTEAERYIFRQLYFAAYMKAKQRVQSNQERFRRLIADVDFSAPL